MSEETGHRGWPTDVPHQAAGGGGIFPLPVPSKLLGHFWSYLPQNGRRLKAALRDVQQCLEALNWLHGASRRRAGRSGSFRSQLKSAMLQEDVILRIEHSVFYWGTPPASSSRKVP